jgi:hypothetical protein
MPEMQQRMHDAVLGMRRPDTSAPRPYDDEPIPALNPAKTAAGVQWSAYAKAAPWLARLDDLKPTASGTSASLETKVTEGADAMLESGFIEIPADGAYVFTLPAGAVALLRIHDATVIDCAFAPASMEASGTVNLCAGKHPFRLYARSTGAAPKLEISGPSIKRQPVPAAMLSH